MPMESRYLILNKLKGRFIYECKRIRVFLIKYNAHHVIKSVTSIMLLAEIKEIRIM